MNNRFTHARTCGFLVALSAGLCAPASASTLFLSSAGAHLGQSATICVSLEGGDEKIAGLQANLVWDDTCMTPVDVQRLCRANPATGKAVQSALQGRGMLKAILISFSDVNPIPDGELFCCQFTPVGSEGTRCPAVQAHNIIGSTATGTRINDIHAGNTGVFTILGGENGGGVVVPAPVPTRVSSDARQSSGGDGCTIAAEQRSHGGAFLVSLAVLLAVVRRLRPHLSASRSFARR